MDIASNLKVVLPRCENRILSVQHSGTLGGLFNSNGYAKLRDYGVVKDTLNDKISGYGYSDGTTPEGDCGFPGVFSSECNGLCAKMIKVSLFGDKVAVRSSNFTGTWNAWKELTFK